MSAQAKNPGKYFYESIARRFFLKSIMLLRLG
jgi:hypothetical protein